MMKTSVCFTTALLVLGAVFFSACCDRSFTKEQKKKYEERIEALEKDSLKNVLFFSAFKGPVTGEDTTGEDAAGTEVNMSDADTCLKLYEKEMLKRGFSAATTRQRIPIGEVDQFKITQAVKFKGDGLKAFIDKNISAEKLAKGINFRINPGIYTREFLVKIGTLTPEQIEKKVNRIGLFIVPYQGSKILLDSTVKGYDLGGLDP